MLHEETVEGETLALIRRFTADNFLKDFVLVGGTALSLQLGHRKSIDIDLFTVHPFDGHAIADHLESKYKAEDINVLGNTLYSYIDSVKTDMLAHRYPWIRPVQEIEGIRMASIEDIAAMKLNAIVNDGSRLKDFVDIHFLLERTSLDELTSAYVAKYTDVNKAIARNALLFHSEIMFGVDPKLLNRQFIWKDIVKRFKAAISEPKKVFQFKQDESIDLSKADEKNISRPFRKGRKR